MSNIFAFANNVNTTLADEIAPSSNTMTLSSSANLPTLGTGEILALTLNDAATQSVFEVVYVISISGADCEILRGQEGTTAQTWNQGDYVYAPGVTAGTLGNMQQTSQPYIGNPVAWSNLENTESSNFSSLTQLNATSFTIPANTITQGTVIEMNIRVHFTSTGTPSLGLEFQVGGNSTGLFTYDTSSATSGSSLNGWIQLICSVTGSSGAMLKLNAAWGGVISPGPILLPYTSYDSQSPISLNTTIDNTVSVWGTWSAASTSNLVEMEAWTVSLMYPASVIT